MISSGSRNGPCKLGGSGRAMLFAYSSARPEDAQPMAMSRSRAGLVITFPKRRLFQPGEDALVMMPAGPSA